jgi:glutaredoxin
VIHQVFLLTRAGCGLCEKAHRELIVLSGELGFELAATDVDFEAAEGRPALRAEYGDRLPVVLLDGREHSYWEVDEARLRIDLRPD